ncbi:MAG: PIN domain-containing protein [Candidatus Peribacteria bacterium]|nr:MAG: PIN domain-containing protein [Candidatus Peribacteria bacterium]
MKIVDSNVWISFFNREDVNNTRAREVLSELMRGDLCVTDYIILEVSTILTQKA